MLQENDSSKPTTTGVFLIEPRKRYSPPELHLLIEHDINSGTEAYINENTAGGVVATHS